MLLFIKVGKNRTLHVKLQRGSVADAIGLICWFDLALQG
jgi:hypothetical protein